MLILRKAYHNNWVKRITLINKDCYTLVPEDIPYSAEDMKAQLFWIDCWFKSEDQPQGQHAIMMRKFFDMCSKEGSVVLVFGRAETLYKHWQPLMRDGFAESTLKWYLDPKIFFVIRSRRRDAFTRNRTTWHSLTEEVLCFTRKAQSQATKRKQTDMVCPPTRNYDKMFALKYGDINGHPGNVYNHYEPPTNAVRLRDYKGTMIRKNAEKTVTLNEYFVDLFTKEGDLVIDMFAGTASMAMACAKTARLYCGTEIDAEVHAAATTRLLKFLSVIDRGDGQVAEAGVPECVLMQVLLNVFE